MNLFSILIHPKSYPFFIKQQIHQMEESSAKVIKPAIHVRRRSIFLLKQYYCLSGI